MVQDATWYKGMPWLRPLCVRWGPSYPYKTPPEGHSPVPIFGPCLLWPKAGWIKMPLGTELGLGPDNIVLDGDPAPPPPPKKGHIFIVAKGSPISATAERLFVFILCCGTFLLVGECLLLLC